MTTPRRTFGLFGLLLAASCADRPIAPQSGSGSDASTDAGGRADACEGSCSAEPACPAAVPDRCDGLCVNVQYDERNCGTCGNACAEGATCQAGSCTCSSTAPVACGGVCVDTTTNTGHCGGCDQTCAGRCAASVCTLVTELALGGAHSVALLSDGSLAAWGADGFGQLGDGTGSTPPAFGTTPKPGPKLLPAPTSVVDVSAGRGHTCAVAGTQVFCWGDNAFKQLGALTATSSTTPIEITGFTSPTRVAAGGSHSCVLEKDGSVLCWGWNAKGQVGDGTTDIARLTPAAVVDLPAVGDVRAGANHTCALTAGGDVWCWGDNAAGQLGDGTKTRRPRAAKVVGLAPATALALGGNRSCALHADGTVSCWGDVPSPPPSDAGTAALDTGTDGGPTDPTLPSTVPGLASVTAIAVGAMHACAATAEGVACWGDDTYGQLGTPGGAFAASPTAVPTLTNAVELAAGDNHTCARAKDGTVSCWGDPKQGRLGTTVTSGAPGPVVW